MRVCVSLSRSLAQASQFANFLMFHVKCDGTPKYKVPTGYAEKLVGALLCVLSPWTYDPDTQALQPLPVSVAVGEALGACPDWIAARRADRCSRLYTSCLRVARELSGAAVVTSELVVELFRHVPVSNGFDSAFATFSPREVPSTRTAWLLPSAWVLFCDHDATRLQAARFRDVSEAEFGRALADTPLIEFRTAGWILAAKTWQDVVDVAFTRPRYDHDGMVAYVTPLVRYNARAVAVASVYVTVSRVWCVFLVSQWSSKDPDDAIVELRPFRHGRRVQRSELVRSPSILLVRVAGPRPRVCLVVGVGVGDAWTLLLGASADELALPPARYAVPPHLSRDALERAGFGLLVAEFDADCWDGIRHALAADSIRAVIKRHGRISLECAHERVSCR